MKTNVNNMRKAVPPRAGRCLRRLLCCLEVLLLCAGALICFPVSASAADGITLDRPALELLPGETDTLTVNGLSKGEKVTWTSSDEAVASVSASGTVRALAAGTAEITASVGGRTAVCTVYVVEKRHNVFEDNITVSTFWPPEGPGYINEEQYRWMAEAGITYVMGAGSNVGEKQDQLNMLSWCYKYGMQMMVGDDRMGPNMMSMSEEELSALLAEYRNVPGVSGWWLIDEPGYVLDLVEVYTRLKRLAPDKEVYLNFLPGSGDAYVNQVEDFLRVLYADGCTADYYQYDSYNCGANAIDYNRQLDGLRQSWEIGRRNNVRQAAFILSTGHGGYRQPNEDEIRWQMNCSLAFGVKLIQYFTWFCPSDFGVAGRQLGIVNCDGTKTPLYEGVSRVNHETLAIGETLIRLDTVDVRVSGSRYAGLPLTEDFPLSTDGKNELIASFMKDPDTGRYYLMLVSNEAARTNRMSVVLDERIGALTLIDNGTGQTFDRDGQTLTMTFRPGEAYLFALPAGLDLFPAPGDARDGDNIARNAYAYADWTESGAATAISYVNDGSRFQTADNIGWECDRGAADLTFDFGKDRSFNRVDMYSTGFGDRYGYAMPVDFEIQVSGDGTTWKTVKTVTGYRQDGLQAPAFAFDTVSARYLRLHMTDAADDVLALCEVEVYLDNGSLPPPETSVIPAQALGENIAPTAYLSATSSTEAYGWSLNGLTDGWLVFDYDNQSQGYSTDDDTPGSVTLDFGTRRRFDTLLLYPTVNTYDGRHYMKYYPSDFSFDISDDGENWTTVWSVTDYKHTIKTKPLEITFDTVEARFLRWSMTKIDLSCVCVGELQVFWNTPMEEQTEPETLPATEPGTDPVVEPGTEAVTEEDTDPETVTDAGTENVTAADGTETEGPAGGCASAAAPLAILAAAAAAVGLKKKKD